MFSSAAGCGWEAGSRTYRAVRGSRYCRLWSDISSVKYCVKVCRATVFTRAGTCFLGPGAEKGGIIPS